MAHSGGNIQFNPCEDDAKSQALKSINCFTTELRFVRCRLVINGTGRRLLHKRVVYNVTTVI